MPSIRLAVAAVAAIVATSGLAPAAGETSQPPAAPAAATTGLPDGVPPAALRPEPPLPGPDSAAWPFPDAFPRTSGAGRIAGGALQWSDFLYDDHGAIGAYVDYPIAGLAPTLGSYTYLPGGFQPQPNHPSRYNGADLFRVGVGADAGATYWRVDWNTLADPLFPVAQWGIDADASGGALVDWPAAAGVRTAGLDYSIVVSGSNAWLVDARAPGVLTPVASFGGTHVVDRESRSFVVRIPRPALDLAGTSRVWIAAGVATRTGATAGPNFAAVPPQHGGRPGLPAVYNVGFRDYADEPQANNLWREHGQARALTTGDISAFAATVAWDDLLAGVTQPEPRLTGSTNRWYVSSIQNLGPDGQAQGAAPDPRNNIQDLRPNYFGRVQPYSVYVPEAAAPSYGLTWLLHSLHMNHNQYAAVSPNLLRQACERHRAICVTTLGRGPDGWFFDEAEVDFWEVWNRVAADYPVDPARTVLAGYSMGGYGTYRLGLSYPDVFAAAVALAGPTTCGIRLSGSIQFNSVPAGPCATAGDTGPLVGNARWLPFTIAHGMLDELVPVTGVVEQVDRFRAAGYRHRFELYPTADHFAWGTADRFASPAESMTGTVETAPGHVTYSWYPQLVRRDLGLGATGAWWLREPVARGTARATVDATSSHHRGPGAPVVAANEYIATTESYPGFAQGMRWGTRPAASHATPDVTLSLTNVASVGVDLPRAGAGARAAVRVVRSEAETTVTLIGVTPGSAVSRDGSLVGYAPASGRFDVVVGAASATAPVGIAVTPPAAPALALAVPATVAHTDSIDVAATLRDESGPLAGRDVTLRFGDSSVVAVTDANGVARSAFVASVLPGVVEVSAAYAGEPGLLPAAASATTTVVPETTVLAYTGETQAQGETVTVAAVLTEDDGPALAGRVVRFSVDGRDVSATTDATGWARAELRVPDHGRGKTVTVTYDGAAGFAGSSTTATITWGRVT